MAAKKLQLRIITPSQVKVDEKVEMVIMRCISGDMGILADHEPYSAVLDYGILRILDDSDEKRIAIFGGFAKIQDNVLTVLTGGAEWPEDIDRARAESDRERAETRMKERTDDLELQSDQVLLRRSLVRIEVSSYSLIHKTTWEE